MAQPHAAVANGISHGAHHQIQAARFRPDWLLARLYWQGFSTVLTRKTLGYRAAIWKELPRRLTVALSRAKRKMILVAARSVFGLFSADETTFANAQLWKNLLRRTCTHLLWQGERHGQRVEVWGNTPVSHTGSDEPG